jgi:nucleoside phosphorylase
VGGTVADFAVLAAVPMEAEAIGGGVMLTGVGRERAFTTGATMRETLVPGTPVALSGIAHGLDPALRPGELIVATELQATDGTPPRRLPDAELVASDLRRLGLHVRTGPLISTSRAITAEESAGLAAGGAVAWDMESAWLALQVPDHPVAVVRVIVDTGRGEAANVQMRARDRSVPASNGPSKLSSVRSHDLGDRCTSAARSSTTRMSWPIWRQKERFSSLSSIRCLTVPPSFWRPTGFRRRSDRPRPNARI